MSTFEKHKELYENFKKDAEKIDLYVGTQVEAYFLAAFHLIETCAAKEMVHINKHQLVRKSLENNKNIFQDKTEDIWRNFQTIENKIRPKFVYGASWRQIDIEEVKVCFKKIEKICLEILVE